MFILININLLLLLLMIFLVFRNIVKLLYDRKRKVMGANLRTRLVVAFIGLTLLPTTVLFFFSIHFITTSVEFWFNVPIEQALDNSLKVGRQLYRYVEDNNRFFLKRIVYQVGTRNYIDDDRRDSLNKYIQVVQREFNLEAIEIYDADGRRLSTAIGKSLSGTPPAVSKAGFQQYLGDQSTRAISEEVPTGELSRMIGTIPLGAHPRNARGFIILSTLIPPNLTENLASISRGYEEYQQIKLLKQPIQTTYYITLSIVALLVLFSAIWLGFYLAKSISIPIKELAEGTRRVAGGDLRFSIAAVGDDEIGEPRGFVQPDDPGSQDQPGAVGTVGPEAPCAERRDRGKPAIHGNRAPQRIYRRHQHRCPRHHPDRQQVGGAHAQSPVRRKSSTKATGACSRARTWISTVISWINSSSPARTPWRCPSGSSSMNGPAAS